MFALDRVCQTSKASLVELESSTYNLFLSYRKTQRSIRTKYLIFNLQSLHTIECRANRHLVKTNSVVNHFHLTIEKVEIELTYYCTILFPTIFVLKYLDLGICHNSTNSTI